MRPVFATVTFVLASAASFAQPVIIPLQPQRSVEPPPPPPSPVPVAPPQAAPGQGSEPPVSASPDLQNPAQPKPQ